MFSTLKTALLTFGIALIFIAQASVSFAQSNNNITVKAEPPRYMQQYEIYQIVAKAASEYPLNYFSSDTNIITISTSGMITAVGSGDVKVKIVQYGGAGYDYAEAEYDVSVWPRDLVKITVASKAVKQGDPFPKFTVTCDSPDITELELEQLMQQNRNFYCPVSETDVPGTFYIVPHSAHKDGVAFVYKAGILTITPEESRGPHTKIGFYSTENANKFAGERINLFITAPDIVPEDTSDIELSVSGGQYGVDYVVTGVMPHKKGKFKAKTTQIVNSGFIIETFNNPARSGGKVTLNFSIRTYPSNKVDKKASKKRIAILSKDIEVEEQCAAIGQFSALKSSMLTPYIVKVDQFGRDGYLSDSGLFIPPTATQAPLGWMSFINYNSMRLESINDYVRFFSGLRSTYKSRHVVTPATAMIKDLTKFNKRPSFKLLSFDRVKDPEFKKARFISMTVDKKTFSEDGVDVISNANFKLYNDRVLKSAHNNGFYFYQREYQVQYPAIGAQWLMSYKDNISGIEIKDVPIGALIFTPPYDVKVDSSFDPYRGNRVVRVKGKYLGSKPTAIIEYVKSGKVKTKTCRVEIAKGIEVEGNVPYVDIILPKPMSNKSYDTSKQIRLLLNSGRAYVDLGPVSLTAAP